MSQTRKSVHAGSAILLVLALAIVPIYAMADGTSVSPTGTVSNLTGSWELITADAGWTARHSHSSVIMPDGSIILMGGYDGNAKNDVWRSTDNGATWSRVTAHAGWIPRTEHSSAVTPDGTIVLIGGGNSSGNDMNDVWQSRDEGATWMCVNASPGWIPRSSLGIAVASDGSIIVCGGTMPGGYVQFNDVWRSTDKGTTWTKVTSGAPWTPRYGHRLAALPDGSIVLFGGYMFGKGYLNDVWSSKDNGTTWTLVTGHAGWPARIHPASTVLHDGTIAIMGGLRNTEYYNDTWGSSDGGRIWTQIVPVGGWEGRFTPTAVTLPDNSIVLMGGWNGREHGDVWKFVREGISGPDGSSSWSSSGDVRVMKEIEPNSLKQGTDAIITLAVLNKGKMPIHDVEIRDTTLPEFPVIDGTLQYDASTIEPGDSRILTYRVYATKAGSYQLDKTTVRYAGIDGNYHLAYSDYTNVTVLEPLNSQDRQPEDAGFFQVFVDWIAKL